LLGGLEMRTRQLSAVFVFVVFLFGSAACRAQSTDGAAAPADSSKPAAADHAAPEAILRQMTNYLGRLPAFSCHIESSMHVQQESLDNLMVTKSTCRIERPRRIAVTVDEGLMGTTTVCDGKQLTQYLPATKRYVVKDAPDDIADVIGTPGLMSMSMGGMGVFALPAGGDRFYQQLLTGVTSSEYLGLEKLGVKTDRGCIVIDEFCRTNVPGIYAIGDVAGPPMLAHKAEHEGVICIEAIKGLHPHPMDKRMIPGCTYCHPQVASVGLTEQAAKENKLDIRVGRFPFVANGKAVALGEDQGMAKVIFDKKTGQLLGAHLVGTEVTELIQGFVVAMNLETTEEELMHTIFPHPTISEAMKEAVLDAYGRALNV